MEIKLLRIGATLETVGLMQIACEPSADSDLGFRMWGAKDSAGEVTRWLAKNKPALVFSVKVSNLVGTGSRTTKVDSQGNLIVEAIGASDIPPHNEMLGLQGGNAEERFHITLLEKNNLHAPLVLSATNGKPLALNGQELSFLFGSSLKVVNNALEVDPSNIAHASLSGLGSDDHTQYVLASGLRAFTAPVSGVTPTQGSHLVTKDWVEMVLAGSSDFQESVLEIVSSVPSSPAIGARYINLVSVGAWSSFAVNSILQWNGTSWFQAWNPASSKALGARTFVEGRAQDYRFTGSGWYSIPSITDHGQLAGLGDDDHLQYIRTDGTRHFTAPIGGVAPTLDAHLATKKYVDDNKGTSDHGALTGLGDDDHTQYVPRNASRGFTAPVAGVMPTLPAHLATKQYADGFIFAESVGVTPNTPVNLFEGEGTTYLFSLQSAQNEPLIVGLFSQSTNHKGTVTILSAKGEIPSFQAGYLNGFVQLRATFATSTFAMWINVFCISQNGGEADRAREVTTFTQLPLAPDLINLVSGAGTDPSILRLRDYSPTLYNDGTNDRVVLDSEILDPSSIFNSSTGTVTFTKAMKIFVGAGVGASYFGTNLVNPSGRFRLAIVHTNSAGTILSDKTVESSEQFANWASGNLHIIPLHTTDILQVSAGDKLYLTFWNASSAGITTTPTHGSLELFELANLSSSGGSGAGTSKVKLDAVDTAEDYLGTKIVAGSNIGFDVVTDAQGKKTLHISAILPSADLRVFRLMNLGANCGEGSAPTYGNPANCLTLNENGNVSGGDKPTVNNNAYSNGALSPIRISKPATKMTSLSFFGVKGRTNGNSVVSPSNFKLQLWEVSIGTTSHTLVGTYTIPVSSAYQANVQNNGGGVNSIVEGRLTGLDVDLDTAKLYGVTVAPVATWDADNAQVSRIDRLIVNMEVE